MDDENEFSAFMPTTQQTVAKYSPDTREYSSRVNWLKPAIKKFRPKLDENSRIRIFPIPGLGRFYKEILLHFGLGPEQASSGCPVMQGLPCKLETKGWEIFNQAKEAKAAGNKERGDILAARSKDLRNTRYFFSYIIDRKNFDAGVQAWVYPERTLSAITGLLNDPATGALRSVDNLFAGHDIFFVWKKASAAEAFPQANNIQLDSAVTAVTQSKAELKQLCDFIQNNPIESLIEFMDSDDMYRLAMGGGSGDDEDGDDEDDYGEEDDEIGTILPTRRVVSTDGNPISGRQDNSESVSAGSSTDGEHLAVSPAKTSGPTSGGLDIDAIRASIGQYVPKTQSED